MCEENGRKREEEYLQAQWCKWEDVLKQFAFSRQY